MNRRAEKNWDFVAENDEEAAANFVASVHEVHAALETPFVALVREMLDARMTLPEIIRLVLAESEKG